MRLVSGVLGLDDHDLHGFLSASRPFNPTESVSGFYSKCPFICPAQSWRVRIYLLSGISASGDDGNTADLEDYKISSQYLRTIALWHFQGPHSHFMATVVGVDCSVVAVELTGFLFVNFSVCLASPLARHVCGFFFGSLCSLNLIRFSSLH